MTIDLNFYPEKETATLEELPKIVVDCDLAGWSFYDVVRCAYDAKMMLFNALYHVNEDGELRWRRR